MVFTSTKVRRTVKGNTREETYSYIATGVTTGTIITGLNNIEHVTVSPDTMRAGQTIDYTTTPGSVVLAGLTSGDAGSIKAVGK